MTLLGQVEVRVDGEPLRVDTRKAVALLLYLAVTGTSASRDQLCHLLWTDLEADRARSALRRTLSVLRKGLGDRWVVTNGDRVRIDPEQDTWVDTDQVGLLLGSLSRHGHDKDVVCPSCRDPLQQASSLYRGEFLAGFSVRDSSAFEEWHLHQAQAMRRRQGRVLELLAECLAVRQEFSQAAEAARARVELEPLDEGAHRQAMLMSVWAGDRGGALRQYRACVRILDEELGVPPLPETSSLEERILCDDIPPPPSGVVQEARPEVEAAPAIDHDWPTVGRDRELRALSTLVHGSGRRTVVITGDPGVGKTRLVDEVAATADREGMRIVRARAYEGESQLGLVVVGGALRAALAQWPEAPPLDGFMLAEAARLVPELASEETFDSAGSLPDPGARSRFTEAVCSTLATLVGTEGVLILDDLQWADPASLELISYLLRRRNRFPIFTILVWRTPAPGQSHPLQTVIDELAATDDASPIELSPLTPDDVHQLAIQITPDLEESSIETVVSASDGIPLVALEYLRLVDATTEATPRGISLNEVAEARLRGISDLPRQVLAAAAVLGRSFEPDEVLTVGGRNEEETVRALEELVSRGLLEEVEPSRLDFRHDLVRHHARESLSAVRRRLLHRRLADHLILRYHESPSRHSGRIAQHLEEAGRREEAAVHRAAAAVHARTVFAHNEALSHYEAALALGHPEVASIHLGIGDLHTLIGDYSSALDDYRAAAARAEGAILARVEHRLGEVNGRLGRWELAEHHFEQSRRRTTDPDARAELLTDWARLAGRFGDDRRALQLVDEAAAQGGEGHPPSPMALIMAGTFMADPDEGQSRIDQGLDLARRAADHGAEAAGLTALALLARRQGDIVQALGHVHAALAVVERIGDRHRQAALHDLTADLLHESGDEEGAMAQVTRAVELFAEVGTGGLEPEVWKTVPW